jgi:hypothetical protein
MNEIFELGLKYGRKQCQATHRHQWARLSFHIVLGSFIGCSFAFLLAFWLSSL